MMRWPTTGYTYGYRVRTHPVGPLYPQPHGYLRGRVQARVTLTEDDLSSIRVAAIFSARLSPAEYQRRRTFGR